MRRKPRVQRVQLLLVSALAAVACAAPQAESRWDDPAVHALGLIASADVSVSGPEVQPAAQQLRAAVERELQRRGFRQPDPRGPDGVVRLSLDWSPAGPGVPSMLTATASLWSSAGESVADRRVRRRGQPLPDSEQAADALAQELVLQLERSARVQTLARTGVTGPPPR